MIWSAPRALVDQGALRHNLGVVRRLAPGSRVWAVVKANAYGHGLVATAMALGAADGFAVARVEEGAQLREAGVRHPILVLEGLVCAEELDAACGHGLALALHHWGQIDLVEGSPRGGPRRVPDCWIKVDTGMHRLGFPPASLAAVVARLAGRPERVRLGGLLTHLANADVPDDPLSALQCAALQQAAAPFGLPLSIGNSAGLIAVPAARSDWVRPGIMLYGVSPFATGCGADLGLVPVMTLQARLIAIQHRRRGDPVGYGGTYVCPEDMPVGVVGVGYGDGYPRHAPAGTPVLVRGQRVSLIGRVSMDMITIDLRTLPAAAVGDPVTLWGADLPVEEIASRAGTIGYELLCRIAQRVHLEPTAAAAAQSGGAMDEGGA